MRIMKMDFIIDTYSLETWGGDDGPAISASKIEEVDGCAAEFAVAVLHLFIKEGQTVTVRIMPAVRSYWSR
jgi:hypothetical protein